MRVRLKSKRVRVEPKSEVFVPFVLPSLPRVRLKKPRLKAHYAVYLYGGGWERLKSGELKFDPKTPEIKGYHLCGMRLFHVKRVGLTHTTLIDTGDFEHQTYTVENDMWKRLIAKGRAL